MSRLIWIYAACKSRLLSPAAIKEIIPNGHFLCASTCLMEGVSTLFL